ncbi:MAG: hypothetical protein P4L50_18585 [Anaerolineaceae bacterium]|nr:hypothetical protein [Anaerolineaceae bacterium]
MKNHVILILAASALLAGCGAPGPSTSPTRSPATEVPVQTTSVPTPVLPTGVASQIAAPATSVPVQTTARAQQPVSLVSLKMIDDQNGWGVSSSGQILHTSDGLSDWQDMSPSELANLQPAMQLPELPVAFFLDASHAWVTYSESNQDLVVQQTSDAGQTWQPPTTLPAADLSGELSPISFYFLDAQNGWLWADIHPGMMHVFPVLFQTTDGGMSWQTVYNGVPNSSPAQPTLTGSFSLSYGANVYTFLNKTTGLAGTGSLYSSLDGGKTWQTVQIQPPGGLPTFTKPFTYVTPPEFATAADGAVLVTLYEFEAVYMPPGDLFQGLPKASYLAWTHDGGKTWASSKAPALEGRLTLLDGQNGWFLGKSDPSADAADVLYETTDGGKSWFAVDENSPVPLGSQVQFVNPSDGFAIAPDRGAASFFGNYDSRLVQGSYYLLQTRDGGKTWTSLQAEMKGL